MVGGVQFAYSFGPGQVIIGVGPGITNNVTSPNIESIGNPTGVLTLLLPSLQNLVWFWLRCADDGDPCRTRRSITLFNNATNVGTLSYNGVPDPIFAGGFAGIQSTLAFNRVQLTFNPAAPAFAVDNIRFANVTTRRPSRQRSRSFSPDWLESGLLRRSSPTSRPVASGLTS